MKTFGSIFKNGSGLRSRALVIPGLMLAGMLSGLNAVALEPSKEDIEFFENKVRPVLVDNCFSCHSSKAPKLKGGLSVEFRDALLKGGETGPAIVPGAPEKSLLITAVKYKDADLLMPPKDKRLTDQQIADLEVWIRHGAAFSKNAAIASKVYGEADKNHWAFKPFIKPAIPSVVESNWVKTPIDSFIVAKLEANSMKPSAMADKRTLIRRATFDLTGLAPTLEEINNFLADESTNAFEKVVDRLLASPRYGERWGRFWLDTARYSDTKGDIKQQREDFRYPYAWTYRDYVIKSFNDDKPYNKFIIEQLAADKLNLGTNQATLAALGFLTVGDHFNGNNNDVINDQIDVVSKGFLGLTVACARCHDHKFDPIPTKDYYALRGIFASCTEPSEGPLLSKINMTPEYLRFATNYNKLHQELTDMEFDKQGMKDKDKRKKMQDLRREITALEANDPGSPPRAMALVDRMKPADSVVFLRGEAENKGPLAPRRFLEILGGTNRPVYRNGSGRLELAEAIADPKNPLTARVIVNRIWLHHFGTGIVTTPDDFGNQSAPPSHPELLDYMASTFIENGWSMKKLTRMIMLSSVYQETSENNPHYAQQDPENRLLWRANIRKLEFEAVRDSLLAIGGKLDPSMGGRPVNLGASPYSLRRTVYGFVDRRNLPEVYNQFDFANPDMTTGKRYETIVPQQALFMMNSPLVVEQARNLINRVDFRNTSGIQDRIRLLYDIIYQRLPTETELTLGESFIKESPPAEIPEGFVTATSEAPGAKKKGLNKKAAGGGKKLPPAMSLANIPAAFMQPLGPWARYAHALLQSNEAMFIE